MPEGKKDLPATVEQGGVMSAVTADALTEHVKLIGEIQRKVMVKDRHYGVIPGTGNKPTLLKPGAEVLAMTFRLCPVYEIADKTERRDFLAYTMCCTLETIESGRRVATGIASCNSLEKKYRYRWTDTGKPVPKSYWDSRDLAEIGGPGFKPQKNDAGTWTIHERAENDNPFDLQNTIIKMAEKRALIAAILNATAASDYFTQDVEDFAENKARPPEDEGPPSGGGQPQKNAPPKKKPPKKEPEKPQEEKPGSQHTDFITLIDEATTEEELDKVQKSFIKARDQGDLTADEITDIKARGKEKRAKLKN